MPPSTVLQVVYYLCCMCVLYVLLVLQQDLQWCWDCPNVPAQVAHPLFCEVSVMEVLIPSIFI